MTYDLLCTGNPPPSPALVDISDPVPDPFLPSAFSSPFDSAISPDGKNAYVTYVDSNTGSGSIAILTHYPTLKKYLGLNSSSGYVTNPNLNGPTEIAVTPDGKNVFAVGSNSNSLVMYTRDTTTGGLSAPVVWTSGVGGVTNLIFPYGVAISPDGNYVYVTAKASHAIVIFSRFHNTYVFNSSVIDPDLNAAAGLAISPDGTSLYVAASIDVNHGNLVMYHRNPINGLLSKLGTRYQGDCTDYSILCTIGQPGSLDGMKSITKLVVSPDGNQVYAVSATSMAVLDFDRDPVTGFLHISDTKYNGILGVTGLNVVSGIGISPDGSQIYTAGYVDKAVDVFDRDPVSGWLNFNQIIQRNLNGAPPLNGARNVTVSPDGQTILVTASVDNALVQLAYASPKATLSDLAPASILSGGADFTLTVHGKDIVNGAQVYWNGSNSNINTNFINSTTVQAVIPAARIASSGIIPITVYNPSPGGGVSNNTLNFTVTAPAQNPVPSIDHLTPQGIAAGHTAFSLDVYGSDFISGSSGSSAVYWNGVSRTTHFVDNTHLTADIPATDVAQPGEASVIVINPGPGGGTSNQVPLEMAAPGKNPLPSVTSLNPAQVTSHGGASTPITLTVNGSNFVAGATVLWNGSARPTQFVSSTQLTATISASDLSTTGSAGVSVSNPAPGGGESNTVGLAITEGNLPPLITGTVSMHSLGNQTVLVIKGKYFLSNSIGQVNGQSRPTQVISSTELQITFPSTDFGFTGLTRFTIYNPQPDYSLSNPLAFKNVLLPMILK